MQVLGIDINLLRGVFLVLLIIAFLGMWIWAWSSKRKPEFQEMSRLPLEEDDGLIPGSQGSEKEARSSSC
jgi:cytochrome c oxidase cbb3-type subunit 4